MTTPMPIDDEPVEIPERQEPRLDHDAYLARLATLPPRARQVAELLCIGKTQVQVGVELGIALNTVNNHVKQMCDRVGVQGGRRALCAWLIFGVIP